MSFDEFAMAVAAIPDSEADAHFRSQHTFVANEAGELIINFVGRYESLLRDLQYVQQRAGLPNMSIPRLQTAPGHINYRDYYTTDTRDTIAERFRKDIELFGYEFGRTSAHV